MTDRIHAHLDGELSADTLSPEERAAAMRMRAAAAHVARHLAAVPAPDLAARVMAALPAAAPRRPAWRRVAAWLWTPRPVTLHLRPAYGLAGAFAALLALPLVPALAPPAPRPVPGVPVVAERPAPPPVYVQFRLEADDAQRVALAGTFTGWEPRVALRETAPGVWTALVPLRPGVHDYAFVVDGERWVADPAAPQVDDSFGGTNSRISLPAYEAAA
jgi:hypothetical protein